MTQTETKERPIAFNEQMVKAILEGRKTQTRRSIELWTGDTFDEKALVGAIQEWVPLIDPVLKKKVGKKARLVNCPYGKCGDLLWVRESWQAWKDFDSLPPSQIPAGSDVLYVADRPNMLWDSRKRSLLHMPRWASRITLKIINVKVEQLKDISETDARKEGCLYLPEWSGRYVDRDETAKTWFKSVWQSIKGSGSWDENPWVWVIEFEKVN